MAEKKLVSELVQAMKLPEGITVDIQGSHVTLSSAKGKLSRDFDTHRVHMSGHGNKIIFEGKPANKQTTRQIQTIIAHVKNMAIGLVSGYKYELRILYSHFPMTATVDKNRVLIKNYLGEKFARVADIIGDTKVVVKGADITVSGMDKEAVGQTATNIEQGAKIVGKDIRRFQDGIYLVGKGNIEEGKEVKIIIAQGREVE